MRLLVITPEYAPHSGGGIAKYYELMTTAWAELGAEVSVLVCTPFSSFEDYQRGNIRVHFVPLDRVHEYAGALTHLAAAPTYRRWIAAGLAAADWLLCRGDAFDVIETTDFGLLFAPLAGAPGRPPLVVKLHGSAGQISEHEPASPATELDSALARLTEAAVLPTVDALHAYGPDNAVEWESRLGRPVNFVPAPLPLPLPATTVQSARTTGEFSGVVVGRIQSWKGPELLCRAMREMGDRAPADLRIAWVGRDTTSGPGGRSLSSWLGATYPDIWGPRIVPIGARTADEVAALQAAARFVLVPSMWDTFNYTLAEGMALGAVTLGSAGAGASYLIDHGNNGFRFAADDPRALADLILEAHAMSDAGRRRLGDAARHTVARELDPLRAAEASLSAFASIESAPRPSPPSPWIRRFFEPSAGRTVSTDYLENVSIRELARHLKTRVARRIVG